MGRGVVRAAPLVAVGEVTPQPARDTLKLWCLVAARRRQDGGDTGISNVIVPVS
jgi:hypothetical protein